MTRATIRGVFLVAASATALSLLPVSSRADERISPQDQRVQEEVLTHCNGIWAWEIEYESPPTPDGSYFHQVVAASADDGFVDSRGHGGAGWTWSEDPEEQRLVMHHLAVFVEHPNRRQFERVALSPNDPLPGSAQGQFLFTAIGWWPFNNRPAPTIHDVPLTLPGIVRTKRYHVLSHSELVDGDKCLILTDGSNDRLWLDQDRGFAIVAREFYNKGKRVQRVEGKQLSEIGEEIWIPTEIRNILYDPLGNGTVRSTGVVRVCRACANDAVSPAIFDFHPAAGSIETFPDGHFAQVTPGGMDYLCDVEGVISREIKHRGSSSRAGWSDYAVALTSALGCALIFEAAMRLVVRRRAGKSNETPAYNNEKLA